MRRRFRYRRNEAGELADDVAQVLWGDNLGEIPRERGAFEKAMDLDMEVVSQE